MSDSSPTTRLETFRLFSAPWISDFDVKGRAVKVRKTGAQLTLDLHLLAEIVLWLGYYVPVRLRGACVRLSKPGIRIWFSPDVPRPWYLVWLAATWSGTRFVTAPQKADAAFYFEDTTVGNLGPAAIGINSVCFDVSKSRVAEVFEQVFGYPLQLDPLVHQGNAVEKSEINGAHDGQVVTCPTAPRPGYVYQHLIDNTRGDQVEDLRTPCVDGKPVLVFVKQRPTRERFANSNSSVRLSEPQDWFSPDEITRISAFCDAMHLDWGGLDILRDRSSNKLYIVDVNKTDMPPLKLPWLRKMQAIQCLSDALVRLVESRKTETAR